MRAVRDIAFGLLLMLASASAWALGLGQIQVKSQPGQPLLAEIPIISSDPEELRGLQARLASPDVFRRIGLQAPSGIISDLQFTLAIGADGQPLIRVTTPQPVQEAALTFLVEVDWGQGRLVREYTALVDAPRTLEAPLAPPVQAPVAAQPSTVVREPAPAPATPATPVAVQPRPQPAAQPTPVPAQPVATAQPRSDTHQVQRGETLSKIAAEHRGQASLDQMMVAMLQANPEAFIGGDINRLRQGASLRLPSHDQLQQVDVAQASALVQTHMSRWRAARSGRASTQAGQTLIAEGAAPAAAASTSAAAAAAPARAAARLEIAPTGAQDSAGAGTQSGLAAGGEGDMLRQELTETLAARDSEVAELRERVAELEKISSDQQRLLEFKDSQLAQVQHNTAEQDTSATTGIWWWAAPLLLLVAAIAWLFARRRQKAPASGYLRHKTSLAYAAASEPAQAGSEPVDPAPFVPEAEVETEAEVVEIEDEAEPFVEPDVVAEADGPDLAPDPADTTVPAQAAEVAPPAPTPAWGLTGQATTKTATPAQWSVPAWHGGGNDPIEILDRSIASLIAPPADAPQPLTPSVVEGTPGIADIDANDDRLELARAYIELGDTESARGLLDEVAASGDPQLAKAARELLQSLG